MTYMHRGKQYIVVAVSTREHPAELIALVIAGFDEVATCRAGGSYSSRRRLRRRRSPDRIRPIFAAVGRSSRVTARSVMVAAAKVSLADRPALTSVRDAAMVRQSGDERRRADAGDAAVLTQEQIHDVSDYVAAGLPPECRS